MFCRQSSEQIQILVLGDYAVGKTSLIRRYVHGIFSPNYKLTIGVDFGAFVFCLLLARTIPQTQNFVFQRTNSLIGMRQLL
jgi:hypothetical protein